MKQRDIHESISLMQFESFLTNLIYLNELTRNLRLLSSNAI